MVKLLKNYFRNTTAYSPERFILEMFLIIFVLKNLFIIVASGLHYYVDIDLVSELIVKENFLAKYHWIIGFIIVCVAAPIIETIFVQAIPINLVYRLSDNKLILIFTSASLFSILHSSHNYFFIIYYLLAGVIYAWSYIVYRKEGCIAACFVTAIIHSLSNLFPFLNLYFFQL